MEPGSLLFQEADLAFLVSEGQKENPVHGSLTTLHFLTFVNDALAKANVALSSVSLKNVMERALNKLCPFFNLTNTLEMTL